MWSDQDGNHPKPFTTIEEQDVLGSKPKWKSTNPGYQQRLVDYVQALKKNGRYSLTIWPIHCRIGSEGGAVDKAVFDALCEWEDSQFAAVSYVTKGSNIFTEHYSALLADVVDPEDPKTGLNTDLIKTLQDYDVIAISGEASSHCVLSTVTDIANNFGEDNIKKFVYLEDTCSPVDLPPCIKAAEDFVINMSKRGMKVMTSDKFLK
jgi:nicotinamidase/pyrazinamidase